MKIEGFTEKLWRRDCKTCTHAYYLPYEEESGFRKVLRQVFKTRKKFKDKCPVCGSNKVVTTKLVTRIKKKPKSKG